MSNRDPYSDSASPCSRTLNGGDLCRQSQLVSFFGIPLSENPIVNVRRTIHEFDTSASRTPKKRTTSTSTSVTSS